MLSSGNLLDGKYRLTDSLGEGSMGYVWKAVHEGLGRSFAVKFLKDYGPSDGEMRERFLREARLAASVRHRCVVDVVDVGKTPEGTPYMVMEYLDGETLAERLRNGASLRVRDLLLLVEQALLGLDAVHRAGIVHRDLKPENIVLTPDGCGGLVPKLVDFGVSREIARSSHGGAAPQQGGVCATKAGASVGTPLYMAPEQVHSAGAPDGRTDIYAAGVILYEALTGVVPFHHPNLTCLMDLIVKGGAVPMAARRPDLPATLTTIVDRAISVDRAGRFMSAAEMAAALSAVVSQVDPDARCGRFGRPQPKGRPATQPPRGLPTVAARDVRVERKLSAPPVFIGVGIIGVLIVVTAVGAARGPRQRDEAPVSKAHPAQESAWTGSTLSVVVAKESDSPPALSTTVPVLAPEQRAQRSTSRWRPRPASRAGQPQKLSGPPARPAPETFRDPGF